MAADLKSFFSPTLVRRLAAEILRVHPSFPGASFVKQASAGLAALELLDRAKHIARVLANALPAHYPDAIAVLLRSLGPEHARDELVGAGMAPFFYLPYLLFVAERGLEHFDLSLHAQYELTKRFSAEFSIRAYIERDPERTFAALREWAHDDNAHVRRLVSEGTRLRLPWAARVAWLDAHPERVLELLELLKDDPTTLVRRSVANNLNDLGKVRPDLARRTCTVWLKGATAQRRSLIEHALRSAIKRSETYALRLLGYGKRASIALENVSFAPPRVAIGGRVAISFTLRSKAPTAQDLLVDVAVHFVKARGNTAAKVFKVKRVTLPARARVTLATAFSLSVHSTRVPHPGHHVVDVIVNGQALRAGSFAVTAPRRAPRRAKVPPQKS